MAAIRTPGQAEILPRPLRLRLLAVSESDGPDEVSTVHRKSSQPHSVGGDALAEVGVRLGSEVGMLAMRIQECGMTEPTGVGPGTGAAHGASLWGSLILPHERRHEERKYTSPLKSRNLSTFSEFPHRTDLYPVCPVLLGSSKTQRAFEDERLK